MSCSQIRKGSHWYYHCYNVNPTGQYKNTGGDCMNLWYNGAIPVKEMTLKIKRV